MASHVGQNTRRRLDRGGQQARQQQKTKSEPQGVPVGPPWGGYAPDLGAELADWRFAVSSQGLVQKGGILRGPPGFERIGAGTLPLGASVLPAGAGQPAVGLFAHRDPVVTPIALRRYATTADEVAAFFAELRDGSWADIPYAGAGAGLTGDPSGAGVAATLTDFTSYPGDNLVVFANGWDPVYVHVPGGMDYTDFSPSVLAPFKAKSLCAAAERLMFLNTNEAGTAFPYRLRYTTRGSAPTLTGLGAGFVDLVEVKGEGLAVRPLGQFIACYFKKGLALLRQTGDVNDPFAKEAVFDERGIVGTFAVTSVGLGQHFGVFDDGWYYFHDDGRFEQVGLLPTQEGLYTKWSSYFYSQLNPEQTGRTFVQYDRRYQFIWVLWTSKASDHPDRLWIYDIQTDTVWPIDEVFPEVPNVLGQFASVGSAETYETISTTYASEIRAYIDMVGKVGTDLIAVGTRSGLVLQQGAALAVFDGQLPQFSWTAPEKSFGRTDMLKTWESLYLRYLRQSGSAADITVTLTADGVSLSKMVEGSEGSTREAIAAVNQLLTGALLSYSLSGTHPTEITQLHARILQLGMEVRQ